MAELLPAGGRLLKKEGPDLDQGLQLKLNRML